MRVLFVVHSFPPFGLAGVERVTEQTARAPGRRAGHEVTVLARRRHRRAAAAGARASAAAMAIDVRWIWGATGASTLAAGSSGSSASSSAC